MDELIICPIFCHCHLNIFLIGKVDFLQELETSKQTFNYFSTVFGKLKIIWNLTSRSSHVNAIVKEVCGGTLKNPGQTRWNSEWDALKDAYSKKDKVSIFRCYFL